MLVVHSECVGSSVYGELRVSEWLGARTMFELAFSVKDNLAFSLSNTRFRFV